MLYLYIRYNDGTSYEPTNFKDAHEVYYLVRYNLYHYREEIQVLCFSSGDGVYHKWTHNDGWKELKPFCKVEQ